MTEAAIPLFLVGAVPFPTSIIHQDSVAKLLQNVHRLTARLAWGGCMSEPQHAGILLELAFGKADGIGERVVEGGAAHIL